MPRLVQRRPRLENSTGQGGVCDGAGVCSLYFFPCWIFEIQYSVSDFFFFRIAADLKACTVSQQSAI